MNIWIKHLHAGLDAARSLTAPQDRPPGKYFWTHLSRYILYLQNNRRVRVMDRGYPGMMV